MSPRAGRFAGAAGVLLVAVAASGCDRPPATASEYNNSGYTVSGVEPAYTARLLREAPSPPPPNIAAREIPQTNVDPPATPSPSQKGER